MILGTWMYAKTLHLEKLRDTLAKSQLQRGTKAGLPMALLTTSAWSDPLVSDGKMGVVFGVAMIIGVGLSIWMLTYVRQAKALNSRSKRPS
jgi:hypothetical protein